MKKSTEQDYKYTEMYVNLIKGGMHVEDARKHAKDAIYGVEIPEPKVQLIDGKWDSEDVL